MDDLIARTDHEGTEYHLIFVEEVYSDEDHPFTLFVHRSHLTRERQQVAREYFWTKEEAQDYAAEHWGVPPDSWTPRITHRADFSFEYGVSKLGVPVPVPLGFENEARVVVRLNERAFLDGGGEPVVDISGNREGLRYLAALLVLAAESERWDDDYHVHLEMDECVDTNIAATVRGPGYADALLAGEFREGTSGPISID